MRCPKCGARMMRTSGLAIGPHENFKPDYSLDVWGVPYYSCSRCSHRMLTEQTAQLLATARRVLAAFDTPPTFIPWRDAVRIARAVDRVLHYRPCE